jgi:hypothetical protein
MADSMSANRAVVPESSSDCIACRSEILYFYFKRNKSGSQLIVLHAHASPRLAHGFLPVRCGDCTHNKLAAGGWS